MSLREMLSDYWYAFQQELFPRLESELGPMGERYELFVAVLEGDYKERLTNGEKLAIVRGSKNSSNPSQTASRFRALG